jgi:hypothetical protein
LLEIATSKAKSGRDFIGSVLQATPLDKEIGFTPFKIRKETA